MSPENPRIEAENSPSNRRQFTSDWDVVIIGGGLAGLSAAVYLGRRRQAKEPRRPKRLIGICSTKVCGGLNCHAEATVRTCKER